MTPDHPRVRASRVCPVCGQAKDYGLVVCWPCYRRVNMRAGNEAVETLLDKTARLLELDERSNP